MKLHLGCGHKRLDGYLNVDRYPSPAVDQTVDLEGPWPWATGEVERIVLHHVLEHLGQTATQYLRVWQEMYRVLAAGGTVDIKVPHWRHHCFTHDPTHVRAVTLIGVQMLDQTRNRRVIASGGAETPLGLQLGVDFELLDYAYVKARWAEGLPLPEAERTLDAIEEICMRVRAHKPARG